MWNGRKFSWDSRRVSFIEFDFLCSYGVNAYLVLAVVKLWALVLVGEKIFLMGFCMLLGNLIIPFSKPLDCIE